jgi:hypothetical protein
MSLTTEQVEAFKNLLINAVHQQRKCSFSAKLKRDSLKHAYAAERIAAIFTLLDAAKQKHAENNTEQSK